MKRNSPLVLRCASFALALAVMQIVHAADRNSVETRNGTISGQISNAATGAFLEGARVEVKGTGRQVLADREGRYLILAQPGEVMLIVSYTGLASQSIAVTLASGQALIQNVGLTSDVYKMEALVVEGEREGSALATTRQRQAANVKNVVAGDAFGTATEDNVGSFLQRLPGVNIISDTGLVREVMVRGIDSSLNTVEMDGVQMANTNSSGTNRFFDFLQASLSMVESIEVTKAPTPDMPASSIGGSVNMVTRTAFSRANPRVFTYSLGLVHKLGRIGGRAEPQKRWYQEPVEGITPSIGFTYSDVLGKRLGVSFSFSRNTQFGGSEDALFNYQATLNRPAYIRNSSIRVAAAAGPHTRRNINLKLEYK